MEEAKVDRKGRILVPEEVRARLKLTPEKRLRVRTEGNELVLTAEAEDDGTAPEKGPARQAAATDEPSSILGGLSSPPVSVPLMRDGAYRPI